MTERASGSARSPGRAERFLPLLKKYRLQLLCVAGGFLLFLIASRFAPADTSLTSGNALPRSGYGGSAEVYTLTVSGLSEEAVELEIPVSARKYSEEELPLAYEACVTLLKTRILGSNPSLDAVSSRLDLVTWVDEYGMNVDWSSDRPELLDSSGMPRTEELHGPESVTLNACLSVSGSYEEEMFRIPVTLLPGAADPAVRLKRDFLQLLASEDARQGSDPYLRLPSAFRGHALSYSEERGNTWVLLPFLGIMSAVLITFRNRADRQELEKKRRQELMIDYPEIVSKLMVFIGAGMTVRLAWECIVRDYEDDGKRKRAAYEEMSHALSLLKTGMNEGKVYREFGRRCGIRQYMRLAGLLEQNRRAGLAGIRTLLKAESRTAWEERKTLAKRLGEEAGTRLLAPLFLMLVVVMAVIVVPALLSF